MNRREEGTSRAGHDGKTDATEPSVVPDFPPAAVGLFLSATSEEGRFLLIGEIEKEKRSPVRQPDKANRFRHKRNTHRKESLACRRPFSKRRKKDSRTENRPSSKRSIFRSQNQGMGHAYITEPTPRKEEGQKKKTKNLLAEAGTSKRNREMTN